MSIILLIADQARILDLFKVLEEQTEVQLRIVTDLSLMTQDVTLPSPTTIFVQSRLSGLSGEILTNHLKSLMPQPAPRIILLSNDQEELAAADKFADGILDLRRSDEALAAILLSLCTGNERESHLDVSPRSRFQFELDTKISINNANSLQSTPPLPETHHGMKTTHFGSSPPWKFRTWPIIIIAMLIIGITAFQILGIKATHVRPAVLTISPPHTPTPQNNVTSGSKKAATTGIPSFIKVAKADPSYASSHPGWERYLNDNLEFKIYREKGAMRALQVIGRSGRPIPSPLLEMVLKEVSGEKVFRIDSKTEEKDYIIEKGAVPPLGKIVIYRRKPALQINALVVYLQ